MNGVARWPFMARRLLRPFLTTMNGLGVLMLVGHTFCGLFLNQNRRLIRRAASIWFLRLSSHTCGTRSKAILTTCHNRDNSRLAPSENTRKPNNRHTRADASERSPPNRTPASNASTLATCPIFVKSTFALYLLYLDSSLSSRLIGIHMYPSALRPSRLTFYD